MSTIRNGGLNSLDKLHDKLHDGVITDISDSGICLLTTNLLSKGQKITINSASSRPRTAIVRWSERFDSHYYTVGLEFV